ncbi:hypothetical protein, partial [Anabaena sp. FACHB-1391]|uniref:hypothetical protein n=1 Tax=Anabaena sp. FACHB-1391 TaxID=2692771 RepID=UPI001A7EBE6C
TREIIDKILNNHENRPLFIEKNLFSQNPIEITYIPITKYPSYLINLVFPEVAVNISLLRRFILEIIILVIQNSIYMDALFSTNNIIIPETQNTVKPSG